MTDLLAVATFWFVAVLTIASAGVVVAAKNILHAAFSLCMCFIGVAGIYVFLHADFVAAVQLIVYVGGILVLIMFAVMFSSHTQEATGEGEPGRPRLALAAGAGVATVIFIAIVQLTAKLSDQLIQKNSFSTEPYVATIATPSGQDGIGHLLMGEYLLPFEVVSVLILAALIGAVVIVRKETRG